MKTLERSLEKMQKLVTYPRQKLVTYPRQNYIICASSGFLTTNLIQLQILNLSIIGYKISWEKEKMLVTGIL